jgi:hypothetical protein
MVRTMYVRLDYKTARQRRVRTNDTAAAKNDMTQHTANVALKHAVPTQVFSPPTCFDTAVYKKVKMGVPISGASGIRCRQFLERRHDSPEDLQEMMPQLRPRFRLPHTLAVIPGLVQMVRTGAAEGATDPRYREAGAVTCARGHTQHPQALFGAKAPRCPAEGQTQHDTGNRDEDQPRQPAWTC